MNSDYLPSDAALEAFLAETSIDTARLDYAAHMSDIEIRHLGRVRSVA